MSKMLSQVFSEKSKEATHEKFSIIIPTMQKNVFVLNKLIKELVKDCIIDEVIVIDNLLKGFHYNSDKVKIISPKKNLYVNPSWNLGVKKARNNYIGILNDDILLPQNLCKQVLTKLVSDNNVGLIGMNSQDLICVDESEFESYPKNSEIKYTIQEDNLYINHWGISIFGKRENFYKIPENIKIYCGDNFLIHKNTLNNKKCYQMENCEIKHLGSLSSNNPALDLIKKKDVYNYAKIDKRYKNHCWYNKFPSILETIFSVCNSRKHKKITILGVKFKFKSKKLLNKIQKKERYDHLCWSINNINEQIKNIQVESSTMKYQIRNFLLQCSHQELNLQKNNGKKIILYVDWHIPEPDTNAGDRASFSYLQALVNNGYIVKYLPYIIDYGTKDVYFELLKDLNIEIIIDNEKNINIDYVKDWLRLNGNLIDYVYMNRPDMYEKYNTLLRKYINPQAKYIYQGHDIHYLRLQRMQAVEVENSLTRQKDRYEQTEHKIWEDYDAILYFSKEETEIVKSYLPTAQAIAVPLFLYSDFEKIKYVPQDRKDLLFVGGFNHTPNADAMRWFIKEIYPLVLKNNPTIKLNVVGSNCPQDILNMANENIIIHGYISDVDLQNLYNETKIVISPLRYGAGVKGKIIEAMKNQIPVITTDIGAEGINTDLLTVANTEKDFSNALLNLYDNHEKLIDISEKSYNFIKENFSEKFIIKLMEQIKSKEQ